MSVEVSVAAPHGESSVLAHHFDTIEQQNGSARLGMWMFLATEVLFFGGVFVAYTAYRMWYAADFEIASSKTNVLIAAINSFLLLTSSLTMTLAIHAAHAGRRQALVAYLGTTILLGLGFLGFKTAEYVIDVEEGLVPGPSFVTNATHPGFWPEGTNLPRVQLFFMFYYAMTGIHVLHLAVGVGLLGWLWVRAKRGDLLGERFMTVEITSLYWHFVDLAWLFLMPMLYLAGPHTISQLHF